MIGVLLAAGRSRRLGDITDELPKTLLPVAGSTPILEIVLGNLRHVDITRVLIVTGYMADRIEEALPPLRERYGLHIDTVYNDTYLEWNNCYSLWCAREAFADPDGVVVINADTVHPVSVEEALLKARDGSAAEILLATDTRKALGDEEMKVQLRPDGTVKRIHKAILPDMADGEHIGVSLVQAPAAPRVVDALERTWKREPTLYFEDGYQLFVDEGGRVECVDIGRVSWVEVDNASDYDTAQGIAPTYRG